MSQKLFLNTGLETIKGGALHALKNAGNAGAYDFCELALTGVVVDTETFTLGGDTYEINVVATDSTQTTGTGGEFNNTSPVINVPYTGAAKGDIIRVENEFMLVLDASATSAFVRRGFAGSTIAVHGNSLTIFKAVQQVTAGNLPVPVSATAAATADDEIVAAVNYLSTGYATGLGGGTGVVVQNGLKVDAFLSQGTTTVGFAYPADGGVATTAETFTNGTISAFGNGVEPAEIQYAVIPHVVTAGDVSAGAIELVAPWAVSHVFVEVFDASTFKELAWDGAVTVTSSRHVRIDNAGVTDWAAGDTVLVTMVK